MVRSHEPLGKEHGFTEGDRRLENGGAHKLTRRVSAGVGQRARVHAAGMAPAWLCAASSRCGAFGTGSLRETRHPGSGAARKPRFP
jgi:hypothetical protein